MTTTTVQAVGANSEVGTLRTVIVHRPDLAHERLSPTNCHELLFDDVIWVRRARQEFDAFVDLMRERGVDVLLFHELLGRDARRSGGSRLASLPAPSSGRGDDDVLGRADRLDDRDAKRRARHPSHRRRHRRGPSGRDRVGGAPRDAPDGLRSRAVAQPALHARHERMDLRRRLDQPRCSGPRGNTRR